MLSALSTIFGTLGWDGTAVHTGTWRDYSKGPARGQFLTLSNRNASFLIALLSVFVIVTGMQLWVLLCFMVHQIRSDRNPRDGLYHQRQAILRNSTSPFSTVVYLLQMSRAWRSRAAQPWLRQFFIISLSVIHIGVFIAASILVVYVATIGTDGQVLLKGQNICDWWFNPSDSSPNPSFWSIERAILQESSTYAKACYRADTSDLDNSQACRIFSTPSIDFETKIGVPCPFRDKTFCRESAEGPIQIVSQLINSNDHLGVNAAAEDQINFREFMTCSPMPDTPNTDFASEVSTILSGTVDTHDIRERVFYYGPSTGTNSSIGFNSTEGNNYTLGSIWTNSSTLDPYQFQYAAVYSNSTDPVDFEPIPGLMPDNADLSIILLTNSATYTSPFNDTMFGTEGLNNDTQLYYGHKFTVIGCTHEYQFCNPMNGLCTSSGGWSDIGYYSDDKRHFKLWNDDGLTPLQHGTISNIRVAAAFGGIDNVLGLGSDSLLAVQKLSSARNAVSLPLQGNQTVMELQNWFATSLAALQHAFYFHPLSPALPASEVTIRNSGLQELCQRQKIRDPNYASFNVLTLAAILAVGGFIILASLALPSLTGILRTKAGSDMHSQNEWDANELLHLQRSTFEANGIGTWSNRRTAVPVTMPYEKFTRPLTGRQRQSLLACTAASEVSNNQVGNMRYAAIPGDG